MSTPAADPPVWEALFPGRRSYIYIVVPSRSRTVIVASCDRRVLRYIAGALLCVPPNAGPAASLLLTGALRLFRPLAGSPRAWSLAARLIDAAPLTWPTRTVRHRRAPLGGPS